MSKKVTSSVPLQAIPSSIKLNKNTITKPVCPEPKMSSKFNYYYLFDECNLIKIKPKDKSTSIN